MLKESGRRAEIGNGESTVTKHEVTIQLYHPGSHVEGHLPTNISHFELLSVKKRGIANAGMGLVVARQFNNEK